MTEGTGHLFVSIVIPVFNTINRLPLTIKTLENQTYSNFEVIFVDDGSTDGSSEFLGDYVKETRLNARCFLKQHEGVGDARNKGIQEARGEYIWFVDSDDTLPQRAVEFFQKTARETNADLICGIMRKNGTFLKRNYPRTVKLAKKSFIHRYDKDLLYSFSVCNKLFKTSIIRDHNMHFLQLRHAEDGVFLFQFLNIAKNICGCDHIVYRFYKPVRGFGSSTTNAPNRELLEDFIKAARIIYDLNRGADKEYIDELNFRIFHSNLINEYYRKIALLDDKTRVLLRKVMNECLEKMSEDQRQRLQVLSGDLRLEGGFIDKEEISKHPVFAIICSHHKNGNREGFRDSLKSQNAPFYRLYETESREYRQILNDSDYRAILFTDDRVRFNDNTLSYLYRQMMQDKVDVAVGRTILFHKSQTLNNKVRDYLISNNDEYTDQVDSLLLNKMFSVNALRASNISFDKGYYCLREHPGLQYRKYPLGLFLIEDEEKNLLQEIEHNGVSIMLEGPKETPQSFKHRLLCAITNIKAGTFYDVDHPKRNGFGWRIKRYTSEYIMTREQPDDKIMLRVGQKLVPFADMTRYLD